MGNSITRSITRSVAVSSGYDRVILICTSNGRYIPPRKILLDDHIKIEVTTYTQTGVSCLKKVSQHTTNFNFDLRPGQYEYHLREPDANLYIFHNTATGETILDSYILLERMR